MTQQESTKPRATTPTVQTAGNPAIRDRAFISDDGFRNAVREGEPGFTVKVRLTSYRSLPLSCIEGMQLAIDGEPIDPRTAVFTLNNYSHKLDELASLSKVWWFVLDYAELFVPRPAPLAPGFHDVEGTLVTVEPYTTAGRFSHYNSSRKRLLLEQEPDSQEAQR